MLKMIIDNMLVICTSYQNFFTIPAIKIGYILLLIITTHTLYANPSMRFKSQITPQAKVLGDLLIITEDKNHIASIPLGNALKPGKKITKKQITAMIKNKKNTLNNQWRGKKTVLVQQFAITSGTDLINKAQLYLETQLKKQQYTYVELSNKTKLKDSNLPLSSFRAEVSNGYPTAKRVCVRLNAGKHSIPVWFKVKAFNKVLIARHSINNRTVVQDNDFILKTRDIAGLKETPYNKIPKMVWLKKSIHANQILTSQFLTELPAVIRGSTIPIKIHSPRVSIITEAMAQQDGLIGQKIRMKNTQNNRFFIALVTAPNHAEISS